MPSLSFLALRSYHSLGTWRTRFSLWSRVAFEARNADVSALSFYARLTSASLWSWRTSGSRVASCTLWTHIAHWSFGSWAPICTHRSPQSNRSSSALVTGLASLTLWTLWTSDPCGTGLALHTRVTRIPGGAVHPQRTQWSRFPNIARHTTPSCYAARSRASSLTRHTSRTHRSRCSHRTSWPCCSLGSNCSGFTFLAKWSNVTSVTLQARRTRCARKSSCSR